MDRDSPVTNRHVLLVGAAVVVALGLRLWFFTGLIASDDITHAYAGAFMFGDPPKSYMPGPVVPGYPSANGRRIGMNAPMFVVAQVMGVSEHTYALVPLAFSLVGLLIAFAAARRLAGPMAGVTAAWLWAVLPVEVYTATIWMGDSAFAAVLALFLWCFIEADLAPRRNLAWATGAGLALGYLQYLKENAFFLGVAVVAWGVVVLVRERRFDRRPLAIAGAWLAVQIVAACYFGYVSGGDFLYYWRANLARYLELATSYKAPYEFPFNWLVFGKYLVYDWVFGGAFLLLFVFAGIAVARRDLPGRLRLFLGLILVLQFWLLLEALKLAAWTQRYVLQTTAPFILLSAVGLVTALSSRPVQAWIGRAPERLRGAIPAVAATLLVVATAWPLDHAHQQHGRERADVLRDAFLYVDRVADGNERIYMVSKKGRGEDKKGKLPVYTDRAFRFLSGYRTWKGGIGTLAEAVKASSGWVILTHLEHRHAKLDGVVDPDALPANWLEVFRTEGPGRRTWARVYRILPAPPPAPVAIVRRDVLPDVTGLDLQPVTFAATGTWRSGWTRDVTDEVIEPAGTSITVRAAATSDADRPIVGIRIPVEGGLAALRATLRLHAPERIHSVLVYASGKGDERTARWSWRLTDDERSTAPRAITLVPDRDGGVLDVLTAGLPPEAVRAVDVFVRLEPGGPAGFTLEDVAVARPENP